jgi:small GTP-binding protein
MRHLVIGTAGHIDHGKTTLVKALTGTDTDRLKEEKERGISIELGFAFLSLPDGTRAGIVDVPGHERFVKTMVAGVGGIDLVVLVIAADEGVMPQTREHLHICELLHVKQGLVALTKADLVEAEWLEMIQADVTEFLKGTFLDRDFRPSLRRSRRKRRPPNPNARRGFSGSRWIASSASRGSGRWSPARCGAAASRSGMRWRFCRGTSDLGCGGSRCTARRWSGRRPASAPR